MTALLIGIVLFFGTHSVRIFADGWRSRMLARVGEGPWKIGYAVVSLVGLWLLASGWQQTRIDPVVLWDPPAAMRHVAALLTLPAFVLLVAAYVPRNRIRAAVGHPMVLAVKLWAFAHLLSNGRLGDVLFFGALFVWAVLDFRSARRRDRAQGRTDTSDVHGVDDRGGLALQGAGGSGGGATVASGLLARDAITLVVGVGAWVWFALHGHAWLVGVRPFG